MGFKFYKTHDADRYRARALSLSPLRSKVHFSLVKLMDKIITCSLRIARGLGKAYTQFSGKPLISFVTENDTEFHLGHARLARATLSNNDSTLRKFNFFKGGIDGRQLNRFPNTPIIDNIRTRSLRLSFFFLLK